MKKLLFTEYHFEGGVRVMMRDIHDMCQEVSVMTLRGGEVYHAVLICTDAKALAAQLVQELEGKYKI